MADFDAKIREVNEKAGVYGNIYHTWRSTTTLFGILDGQHTVIDGNYDFLKPYYEQVLSEQADGVIPNYGRSTMRRLPPTVSSPSTSASSSILIRTAHLPVLLWAL